MNSPSNKTFSSEITNRLLRRVVDGIYPAGGKLPTERQLSEEFGVARTVIREALKRIEALNLITIRQGSGALVNDFQTEGGIELANLLMVNSDGNLNREFLKDVGQLHEGMHIWLVGIVAKRITTQEINELKSLLKERAAMSRNDIRLPDLTLKLTRRIVQASHNRYFQLLFNTLSRTSKASRTVFESPVYFDPEIQTFFERLVETFENRDPEMARLLVTRVFESNQQNYLKSMGLFS